MPPVPPTPTAASNAISLWLCLPITRLLPHLIATAPAVLHAVCSNATFPHADRTPVHPKQQSAPDLIPTASWYDAELVLTPRKSSRGGYAIESLHVPDSRFTGNPISETSPILKGDSVSIHLPPAGR